MLRGREHPDSVLPAGGWETRPRRRDPSTSQPSGETPLGWGCPGKSEKTRSLLFIVQVTKSCPALCDPMDCSTPSFPVLHYLSLCFPGGSAGKESTCNVGDLGSIPGLGRFPWRREQLPAPVFSPRESHGQRSLADYIQPMGSQESDTAWRLNHHHHHIDHGVAKVGHN